MKNHHGILRLSDSHLDENGVYTGHFSTFAPCGFIRAPGAASIFQLGDGDSALDRLWQKKKVEVHQ
ncbi:hypothetical protein CUMW_019410 [Citrus unshiu]|nr:hypothetical protein CUMW_019410 [Citrus unshiu]